MMTEPWLILPIELYQQMEAHIMSTYPEEGCGIVGGKDSTASVVFCIENELHSPVQYRMKPEEQLQSMVYLDHHNLDFLAAFHSHPNGPQQPSETDIEQWYYFDAVLLIWFQSENNWQLSGFSINGDIVTPVEIQVVSP